MRHIVWALGESFFIISFILFDINQYFIAYTGGDLQNTRNRERPEAQDASHLELQVNCYRLTPKSSTGKAGA